MLAAIAFALFRRIHPPSAADNTRRGTPHFRELDRDVIEVILRRNHVGRMAFSFHDRVDIEPIGYVYEDGWIYGRTSPGAKLSTLAHRRWVAFEVDEVGGPFDWRSVVVHGALYVVTPDGPPLEARAWERAVALLREILPETMTETDPVPFRTVVFRIAVESATGRACSLESVSPRAATVEEHDGGAAVNDRSARWIREPCHSSR